MFTQKVIVLLGFYSSNFIHLSWKEFKLLVISARTAMLGIPHRASFRAPASTTTFLKGGSPTPRF